MILLILHMIIVKQNTYQNINIFCIVMTSKLNNNFAIANFLLSQQKKKKTPSPKKIKKDQCKVCKQFGGLIQNMQNGQILCTKCGVTQGQIFLNQSPQKGNTNVPKVYHGKLAVADPNIKVKYLVIAYNMEVTNGLSASEGLADRVMGIYGSLQKQRGQTFRGFKMSDIVLNILYCLNISFDAAMPLSMMINIMNSVIDKSLRDVEKCSLQRVEQVKRTLAIPRFMRKMTNCIILDPTKFINSPLNYFKIPYKSPLQNHVNKLCNEINKEIPEMSKPPAVIALGCVYFSLQTFGTIDHLIFGVHKNSLNSIVNIIKSSQNPRVITLVDIIEKFTL